MKIYCGIILCVLFVYEVGSRDCPGSKFGPGCRFRCRCRDQASCNEVNGDCPTQCEHGWSGPHCQRQNMAYRVPVEVRKVNTSGLAVVDENDATCISSRPNRTGWLKVDLGSTKMVYSMRLISGNNAEVLGWRIHVTDYNHDDLFWGHPCTTIKSRGESTEFHCDHPSYGRYVSIFSYDRPVNICDFRIYACSNYTYGEKSCLERCTCLDSNEVCHTVFGTCTSGCQAGLTGSGCQEACVMSYGSNCIHNCGHCLDGRTCNRVSGTCPLGCDPGYTGVQCTKECIHGYYGRRCQSRCGNCKDDANCNHVNGHCPAGCTAGWYGNTCRHTCKRGTYGEDCKFTCQNCRSSICNRMSGVCESGCVHGWEGVFCNQECLSGSYGANCLESCGNCKISPCHRRSGRCNAEGCEPGFYGDTCLHECPAGKYGSNCKHSCGVCLYGASCDPRNGSCPGSCDIGWTGDDCSNKCAAGIYGDVCNNTCGVCVERIPCNHVTGKCDNGCAEGFHGDFCVSTEKVLSEDVSNAIMSTFVSAVGTIIALFLVLLLACIIIKWRQEKSFAEYDHRAKRKLLENGHV